MRRETPGMLDVLLAVPLELPSGNAVFCSFLFSANFYYPSFDYVNGIVPIPFAYINEPGVNDGSKHRIELPPAYRQFGDVVEDEKKVNGTEKLVKNKKDKKPKTKRKSRSLLKNYFMSRRRFYKMMETNMNSSGLQGSDCLLRAICETSEASFAYHNGVIGNIVDILFLPSASKDEKLPKKYYRAETDGKTSGCDANNSNAVDKVTHEKYVDFGKFNKNYEQLIRMDIAKQVAKLGDDGKAVVLTGKSKEIGDKQLSKIALNEELSEHLSYNRTTPDARNPLCRNHFYDLNSLPTTSVVIIFYNEPYSVIVRTIHSVLNTCDRRILKEIILVDDGSTLEDDKGKLDYYIDTRLPTDVVKVLRLKSRMGLIRARLAGARLAKGDVLVFLDAHCEGVVGWLEPLLQRIKESRSSVLVPIIDVIDAKDFHYSVNGYKHFQVGGFSWSGHFDWIDVTNREKKRRRESCDYEEEICPTYSPTMAGGLFAISRDYFWEIGSYDEQMDGWGGENLEMSFRIWQCKFEFILLRLTQLKVAAANINLCLDDLQSTSDDPYNMGVYVCHRPNVTKSQFFSLTNEGVLRSEEACATVQNSSSSKNYVVMVACSSNSKLNEKWEMTQNHQIRHIATDMCLDHIGLHMQDHVFVRKCDAALIFCFNEEITNRKIVSHFTKQKMLNGIN
ncbi:Polypeptide N-acetylgalactosaminyltransferase 1 [Pseudolycoriella hygida]|uniref:Polypeptide N-acetylgalactosaminyltransferase n=1 Tax=Pseudolycoriella hygida TaxID=35572 RepID=A0A9Q0MZ09_9DIPT|nr:Polypeptide N-acetylgalactosaminyltransferase 1 [Pseudolycoriella hygida]